MEMEMGVVGVGRLTRASEWFVSDYLLSSIFCIYMYACACVCVFLRL